jgi:serine/threonine protein kinase
MTADKPDANGADSNHSLNKLTVASGAPETGDHTLKSGVPEGAKDVAELGPTKIVGRPAPGQQQDAPAVTDKPTASPRQEAEDADSAVGQGKLDEAFDQAVARAGYDKITSTEALSPSALIGEHYFIGPAVGASEERLVYVARDSHLDIYVLIKEFFPSGLVTRGADGQVDLDANTDPASYAAALKMFIAEARTLGQCRHPNITRVRRVIEENNTAYLVLNLDQGQTLDAWLKGLGRPLTQSQADALLKPLLDALDVVHGANFLHRRICPETILIKANGQPVLRDFSAARQFSGDFEGEFSRVMQSPYAAPEAVYDDRGSQGPWTDIFGLGATFHRAVTGIVPSERAAAKETVRAASNVAPGGFRPEFLDAIDKAMTVNVAQRTSSVSDWRHLCSFGDATVAHATQSRDNDVGATRINQSQHGNAGTSDVSQDTSNTFDLTIAATRLKSLAASGGAKALTELLEPTVESGVKVPAYERWLARIGIFLGVGGLLVLTSARNYGVVVVLLVIALALVSLRGLLPLRRFLKSQAHSDEQTIKRAEAATLTSTRSIVTILATMTLVLLIEGPILGGASGQDVVPRILFGLTLLMGLPALFGAPLQGAVLPKLFGIINAICLCFFVLFVVSLVVVLIHGPGPQVNNDVFKANRYIFGMGSSGIILMCFMNFVCRLVARRRVKRNKSAG